MTRIYELVPTNGRKSFYGKAKVVVKSNVETLYSYGTPIMKRFPDGKLKAIWDGWSATTGRHITAFCGLNKREYFSLLEGDLK